MIKYQILLFFFIINALASLALSLQALNPELCTDGGCSTVQTSKYASTFGVKNSFFGLILFSYLAIITFFQINNPQKQRRKIIHAGVIIASIIALYFLFLQQFILNSWCRYCIIIDTAAILSLILVIFTWKK